MLVFDILFLRSFRAGRSKTQIGCWNCGLGWLAGWREVARASPKAGRYLDRHCASCRPSMQTTLCGVLGSQSWSLIYRRYAFQLS